MQQALGLTPEPAPHALVFLHPAAERTARAMLSQTSSAKPAKPVKPATRSVPRQQRRLSAASAVTPIAPPLAPPPLPPPLPPPPPPPPPLPNSRHPPSPRRLPAVVSHDSRHPQAAPASPITPHHQPTARALFIAPTPPLLPPSSTEKPQAPAFPSLFSTASGKRLALPPAATTRNSIPDLFADVTIPPNAEPRLMRSLDAAPLLVQQSRPAPNVPAPAPAALFTTGSGKPVPLPPASKIPNADPFTAAFNTPRPRQPTASLFTTASGKPVPMLPPSAPIHLNHRIADARWPPFTTPQALGTVAKSTTGNQKTPALTSNAIQPNLPNFATPSPLPRLRPSHIPPSSASKWNPSAATSNTANPSVSSSLFRSAAQSNAISLARPSNSTLDTRSASRSHSLPSPHTPSMSIGNLRKALFQESARNSSAKKSSLAAETPPPQATRVRRRRASGASNSRTTPFKRPRRILRPVGHNSATKASVNQSNVPQFSLPALLTNGLTTCTNPDPHNCPTRNPDPIITSKPLAQPHASILQSPTLLSKCHGVIFRKHEFGHVSCLPPLISNALSLVSIETCDVSTFVQWTKQMFPGLENKPASCVGSAAWTRMVYSLAICKLMTLQSKKPNANQLYFFCAANVVREFLRRFTVEWHQSKQPHLLRIMRNDSNPSSHIILRIVEIERSPDAPEKLNLVVSDGWYVARCSLDDTLQSRVWRGLLRVGDKISITASTLQTLSTSRPFFFGEADELGSSYIRVSTNGLHKAPADLRLGIRKPTMTKSLKRILDDHGTCPPLQVVILRTYPVFYRETIAAVDEEEKKEIICRREEAEDEARAAFEEKVRRDMLASVEKQKRRGKPVDATAVEVEQRCIVCVKDMLVCGIEDDPLDSDARKLIRIYNVPESLQGVLRKEGQTLCLTQVWPRSGIWICKSESVRQLRPKPSRSAASSSFQFPRKMCSIADLYSEEVQPGEDFDGVFAVLHVTPCETRGVTRFVYLTDDPENDISVLALELCDEDAKCLPRALRFRGGLRPRFPLVVLQDTRFKAISKNHDLVHAQATLRSSVLSARAVRRQRKRTNVVKARCEKVDSHLRGKEEQLDILREAVVSFVSGEINSIGAYFTSTQDM
ncbi:unnamed protein product [Agarophyton chilense]